MVEEAKKTAIYKQKELDDLFNSFEKDGSALDQEFFETGNVGIDIAVSDGRGLPVGGVVSFCAAAGAGKSTTCIDIIKRVCAKYEAEGLPYKVAFFDNEVSRELGKVMGLNQYIDSGTLLYKWGPTMMEDLEKLAYAISKGHPKLKDVKLLVVDSINNCVCQAEVDSSIEKGDYGNINRIRNRFYKKYLPELKKHGVTCIFVTQERGNQEATAYTSKTKSALSYGDKHSVDTLLYFSKATGGKDPDIKKKKMKSSTGDEITMSDSFLITIRCDGDKNRYGNRVPVKTLVKYGKGADNWWLLWKMLVNFKHMKNAGTVQKPDWNISSEFNEFTENSFPAGCKKAEMIAWLKDNISLVKDFLKLKGEYRGAPCFGTTAEDDGYDDEDDISEE